MLKEESISYLSEKLSVDPFKIEMQFIDGNLLLFKDAFSLFEFLFDIKNRDINGLKKIINTLLDTELYQNEDEQLLYEYLLLNYPNVFKLDSGYLYIYNSFYYELDLEALI